MICRCGAQFCYVCGKVWLTCDCTERQLAQMKRRTRENAARRQAQEERERRETQELKTALEAIARVEAMMEAADAEKLERICAAKEAQRKKHVHRKYDDFRTRLNEINEFQRGLLDAQHVRDRGHLELRIEVAMDSLRLKHDARLSHLRTSLKIKIEEKEKELDQDWQERVAREKKTEAEYRAQLDEWVTSVKNGEPRKEELLKAHKSEHDQGRDGYLKKRDELERLRWVLDERVAIEQELMDVKKTRIEESFEVQQRELQAKVKTELRWLELVFSERSRLLHIFLVVELADQIVDNADDRWNTFIIKGEAEAYPSRFRFAQRRANGKMNFADTMDEKAGPSSERQALESREPTPPPGNPFPLSSALQATWDSARDPMRKRPSAREKSPPRKQSERKKQSTSLPPTRTLSLTQPPQPEAQQPELPPSAEPTQEQADHDRVATLVPGYSVLQSVWDFVWSQPKTSKVNVER